ncbi:hypothetical protein [Enterococcus casseliflavus]|uniref:Uncharacterized protein n=1 Tax=Enterococcus casseliflavus TaxID=37734 RepID=A0ABD5FKC7_ENTCA|nr:hypothetical protein [Enterococcus casseliflavus]MDT2982744.1 hypothetical protein [Enterococcus casseliflavus]MDU3375068.1 hypothetical protein [Enterococcus casseliflavus]SFE47876.1 hypothetical protein SAMN04487887_11382 [Enterococcus casseliflavus]
MVQVEVLKFIGFVTEISPKAFINRRNELILVPTKNIYFNLNGVESKRDITVKILHWLSRPAHKGVGSYWENRIRAIINNYLQTDFNRDDFYLIYTELGNATNPELTEKFIDSDYDLKVLEEE